MKQVLITIIILCLFSNIAYSQQQTVSNENPDYSLYVELGEQALNAEKYDSCLIYYKNAFEIKQTSFISTLRAAACGYSLQYEAFYESQLDKAFDLSWEGAKYYFDNNPEFQYLLETPFAEMIENRYITKATAAGINFELLEELRTIEYEDQRYLKMEKYDYGSSQMDSLWVLQKLADSINMQKIAVIIDSVGYPGRSMVTHQYSSTAFLVIQHNKAMQEEYLPIVTAAADAGEVPWASVALLVDRVNVNNGKKQIYGSQVKRDPETAMLYFFEIENPVKIDSIRESVNLGTLQEYAQIFGFDWNVDEHIKRHSGIEKEAKNEVAQKKEAKTESNAYREVDEMPRFPGCEKFRTAEEMSRKCTKRKVLEFFESNIEYPEAAKTNKVEGMVIVQFIVDEEGKVTNGKVLKDINGYFKDPILTAIDTMPIWNPGKEKGINVKVIYTMPILFKMPKEGDLKDTESPTNFVVEEKVKEFAPDFEMTMEDGSKKKLSDFKGQIVYISFWASWCGPCIKGFNEYREMREDIEKLGVVMLNVSIDEDSGKWKEAIAEHQPTGIHAHVPHDDLRELYQLYKVPEYEIVGKNGQFLYLSDEVDRNILENFKQFIEQ